MKTSGKSLGRKPKLAAHERREAIQRCDHEGEPGAGDRAPLQCAREHDCEADCMTPPADAADRDQYRTFVYSQMRTLAKNTPPILWHYTQGDALAKIIQSGTLFGTQIACVNDATEYAYSVQKLHQAFKRLRQQVASQPDAIFLLDYIDAQISTDTSTSEWFVTCFSVNRDDLSQWRAYSSGENGYALGFNGAVVASLATRNQCLLAPVHYDESTHDRITDAVANATVQFFQSGWQSRKSLPGADLQEWALLFLAAWVDDVTYLAPVMKHPGFAPESEWRIIYRLQEANIEHMVYLQKKTLMSRHLPLSYVELPAPDNAKLLPLDEIMVGPSRHKKISKVSVADLLRTCKYPEAKRNVTVSRIPYQEI